MYMSKSKKYVGPRTQIQFLSQVEGDQGSVYFVKTRSCCLIEYEIDTKGKKNRVKVFSKTYILVFVQPVVVVL